MLSSHAAQTTPTTKEFVLTESDDTVSDVVGQAIGERVRYWRTERGLLMRQLADAAGVKQPFLSKIERGDASPSMLTLYRIATALDITPGDLLPAVMPQPGATVVRASEGRQIAGTESSSVPVRFVGGTPAHSFEISEMEFNETRNNNEYFDYPTPAATHLIEGTLDVTLKNDRTYRLTKGDTIFCPAKHSRAGKPSAEIRYASSTSLRDRTRHSPRTQLHRTNRSNPVAPRLQGLGAALVAQLRRAEPLRHERTLPSWRL